MPPSPPCALWENIVPFHNTTQWLCYSLMQPMTKLLNIQFAGTELLTGLPEYRNGGLLVDTGLLTLKEHDAKRGLAAFRSNSLLKGQQTTEVIPLFATDDDVIAEWRAVTVGLLDELLIEVNGLLGLRGSEQITLAQMLEAGSWKVSIFIIIRSEWCGPRFNPKQGGRELAEVSRPNSKAPPIMILSDGTVF